MHIDNTPSKAISIDEVCGQPEGSFGNYVKAQDFDPNRVTPEQFVIRLRGAIENLHGVAEEYVAILEVRPGFGRELMELGMRAEMLRHLDSVGRGQLLPEFAFGATPGEKAVARLPVSEQKLIKEAGGVKVWDEVAKDTRTIPAPMLTAEQTRIAVGVDAVREPTVQRTIYEKRKPKVTKDSVPYRVEGELIYVSRPCYLSEDQTEVMLRELRRQKRKLMKNGAQR